jgi:hypothetical protein
MEERSAKRALATGSHGAEIKLVGVPLYQFKLKDISDNGAGILVKEDSAMINHLEVGQSLEIKFQLSSRADFNGYFESKIKHITKMEAQRYKGHYLVGVQFLAKKIHD